MTKWTDFVKQFSKERGISYKEAMSHPDAKAGYKSGGKIHFKNMKEVKHEFQHPKEFIGGAVYLDSQGHAHGVGSDDPKFFKRPHPTQHGGAVTQGEIMKHISHRGRGRPRKDTSVGHAEAQAVQDIGGNWVIPSKMKADKQTPAHQNPSLVSHKRIKKNMQDLATKVENIVDRVTHRPDVAPEVLSRDPLIRRKGQRVGGSLASALRHAGKSDVVQMGQERSYTRHRENLGLGANAGRGYISL
jgi:hypothetical protein